MANEPVQFDTSSGLTSVQAFLYSVLSPDLQAYGPLTCTERTNNKASYTFSVVSSIPGTYLVRIINTVGLVSSEIVKTAVVLTGDTTLKYCGDLVNVIGGSGGGSGPTVAQIVAGVWRELLNGGNFDTVGSIGNLLKTGAVPPTAAQIATYLLTELLSNSDFNVTNSLGALLKNNLDVNVGSRLIATGYTAPDNANILAAANSSSIAAALAAQIQAKTALMNFFGVGTSALLMVDLEAVVKDTGGLVGFNESIKTLIIGTVGSGSTRASVIVSSIQPAIIDTNQFSGLLIKFTQDTITAALRGQGVPIGAVDPQFGTIALVNLLSEAPQAGDTFVVL